VVDAGGRYLEFCKNTFPPELNLRGTKIVVDCAHGAAYAIAPKLFRELGADVIAIGAAPDGFNINDGVGATHPKTLAAKVIETNADIGIALDGDADRLIVVDENGQILDGDQIMALIANLWFDQNLLKGESITVLAPMADVTDVAFRSIIAKYSKPHGPHVTWTEFVSADEVPAGMVGMNIETRLNGQVMQKANTKDMIFDVATLVVACSEGMELHPGDMIITGTPSGVGFARKPPVFMKAGDVCEVVVEGLGTLSNPVINEA
jgi:hypothetical protein